MALAEMDITLIRAIRYLHSNAPDSQNSLRILLDEAIKNKYGPGKELSTILNLTTVFQEYPVITTVTSASTSETVITTEVLRDESRTGSSSDNELELDLLKEDLMCVICKGMGVGARNRLLECSDCHCLYHQECHDPPISQEEIDSNLVWICASCKIQKANKDKVYYTETTRTAIKPSTSQSPVPSKLFLEAESPDQSSSISQSTKLSSAKVTSAPVSSRPSPTPQSSRIVTPNINIISADKRLQIMKKKAAKMQEKRKHTSR